MRLLIILAAVILLLAFAGWLTFTSGPGRTSINLETDEIREDTQEIVRSGSKVLRDAENGVTGDGQAEESVNDASRESTRRVQY